MVLLYAVNRDALRHASARGWLDEALSGGARVAFCWLVLLAFLRLSTNGRIFDQPLSATEAITQVEDWLAQPSAVVVEPTARHLGIVQQLLGPLETGGNLVNDAPSGCPGHRAPMRSGVLRHGLSALRRCEAGDPTTSRSRVDRAGSYAQAAARALIRQGSGRRPAG